MNTMIKAIFYALFIYGIVIEEQSIDTVLMSVDLSNMIILKFFGLRKSPPLL